MDKIFQLEIGSWLNLKGNAVIYWEAKAKGKTVILAVNFCISAFPFEGNLIATTFPLTHFFSREEFMFYIQRSSVDLISLGLLEIEVKGEYFLSKAEYKQLNAVIEYYLNLFRGKIADKVFNLTSFEKVELLKTWLNHLQRQERKTNKTYALGVQTQIKNLVYDLFECGLPPKDLEGFLSLLESTKRGRYKLMFLYLQEFLAILEEEYEQVLDIKKDIAGLQVPKNRKP